ncbi:MAG: hypothetical protein KIH63_004180 [Candidatus Saccharibacteria bacterium]|nr:hypothetical protein [Candidatus Saccharibacteria bacterium]
MSSTAKETIYIDIDDDITNIIDKVGASEHKIVALVLPKRATTLQSIVNMKLLKRTAGNMDKRLVLITSEAALLPLAGIVGLHVAKTLQSKPAIPPAPDTAEQAETLDEDDEPEAEDVEPEIDETKPVGELAGMTPAAAAVAAKPAPDKTETIELDDDDPETPAKNAKSKDKKNKIKIPNFESFRLKLVLGVLAFLLLIGGYVMAFNVLPKARVVVRTNNKSVTSSLNFSVNTAVTEVDAEKSIVPAEVKEVSKTDTVSITATGQKNVGEKAKGTAQLFNCSKEDKLSDTNRTVPAGTAISSGGLSFILDEAVIVPPSSFDGNICKKNSASVAVGVTAQNGGEQYNLSARSYAVAGFGSMTASGSAMAGGTNTLVTIVSQQDVDNAKTQVIDQSKELAKEELKKAFSDAGLLAIDATITGEEPALTPTPAVGQEATTVSISSVRKYTMLGVKEDNLKPLIDIEVKKQVDVEKQPIVDYGIGGAIFKSLSSRSGTDHSVSTQVTSLAGVKIDAEAIKEQVKGKKRGEAQTLVQAYPGVQSVEVSFSPPWVSKIPGSTSKIAVFFEQVEGGENNQPE